MEKSKIRKPSNENGELRFVEGSGDVFRDIGLNLTREEYFKIEIARAITQTINQRRLTQTKAAQIVGTDPSKISAITRGQLKSFSPVRLLNFLLDLGRDVKVNVSREYSEEPGKISVCG